MTSLLSPLTIDDFSTLVAHITPIPTNADCVAVAVSGGSDSLCLTFLLHQWALHHGKTLYAFVVDHQLRPTSTQEAQQVCAWLQQQKIKVQCLTWHPPAGLTRIQERARDARYALLQTACREHNISFLFLGHHLEDQAETLLMRLCHGTGVDGLAAMRPMAPLEDIILCRPLLSISKKQLEATLQNWSHPWIHDSSNDNPKFERVRRRHWLKNLSTQDIKRLNLVADKAHRAKQALDFFVEEFWARNCCQHPEGVISIPRTPLLAQPLEVQYRLLSKALRLCSGAHYPPKELHVETLRQKLTKDGYHTGAQCLLYAHHDQIWISRNFGKSAPTLPLTKIENIVWDKRLAISVLETPLMEFTLRPLGAHGTALLPKEIKATSSLPHKFLFMLPSLWHGEMLVSVPHLGYTEASFKDKIPKILWSWEAQ